MCVWSGCLLASKLGQLEVQGKVHMEGNQSPTQGFMRHEHQTVSEKKIAYVEGCHSKESLAKWRSLAVWLAGSPVAT